MSYEAFGYNSRAEYEYYNPPYTEDDEETDEDKDEEREEIIEEMTAIAENIYNSDDWETEEEYFDIVANYDLSDSYPNYEEHYDCEIDEIFTECAEKVWNDLKGCK